MLFGKDDTVTAYLVSFLNLLNRVQSCDDNHLLLGDNCEEDHPLMKSYPNHLREEMEHIEGKTLTSERGEQVVFKFELIPSDMKWISSHLRELNNCATCFSPFANVNQTHKRAMVLLVALKQHAALSVVMQYTNQSHLKAATTFSDLPDSSPLLVVLKCLKDNVKCGRLHKAFLRWFSEKQKKVIIFSYGFTELESKYFCWHFVTLIQELLKINSLSKKSVVKLHTLALLQSNSGMQFLFTQESRCALI